MESATPYYPSDYQKQQKQKKAFLLATVIEAVLIAMLIIWLGFIIMMPSNPSNDMQEIDDEESGSGGEDYDNYAFMIDDSESTTLKYLYALANNQSLNVGLVPRAICETVSNLYNKFSTDGSTLTDPCVNNQIVLATKLVDSEFYPNPLLYKFSIVVNSEVYGLYAHLDLLRFSYVDKSFELPKDSIIIEVSR